MSQKEYRDAAIEIVKQLSIDVGVPTICEKIRKEDLDSLASDDFKDACYIRNLIFHLFIKTSNYI